MNHPKFNFKDIYSGGVTNGAYMNVSSINNMPKLQENKLRYIQFYNSGKKERREDKHFSVWNGTSFVDIDYKHYYKNVENATEPLKVMNDVYSWLQQNCKNFYYGELSRSKTSFHFIFYIETQYPSEERAEYLKLLGIAAVKKAFISCGYLEAYNYPNVADKCSDSYGQGCYLTGVGQINKLCEPSKYDIKNFTDIFEELKTVKTVKCNKKQTNTSVKALLLNKNNDINTVEYIPHLVRRSLFFSLSKLFSGDDLKNEWIRCAKMIPEDEHDTNFYINAPYKNDWNDTVLSGADVFCDKELLKKFGYNVQLTSFNNEDKKIEMLYKNLKNILDNVNE